MKVAYEEYNFLDYNNYSGNLFRNIRMVRIIGILLLLISLTSCGFLESTIGLSSTATATAGSSYSSYKSVTMMKTGVDTGLAISGQKTTTDMFISGITGKDCDIIRKIKNKEINFVCQDVHPIVGKK